MNVNELLKVDLGGVGEYSRLPLHHGVDNLIIVENASVILILQEEAEVFVVFEADPVSHDNRQVLDAGGFFDLNDQLLQLQLFGGDHDGDLNLHHFLRLPLGLLADPRVVPQRHLVGV